MNKDNMIVVISIVLTLALMGVMYTIRGQFSIGGECFIPAVTLLLLEIPKSIKDIF